MFFRLLHSTVVKAGNTGHERVGTKHGTHHGVCWMLNVELWKLIRRVQVRRAVRKEATGVGCRRPPQSLRTAGRDWRSRSASSQRGSACAGAGVPPSSRHAVGPPSSARRWGLVGGWTAEWWCPGLPPPPPLPTVPRHTSRPPALPTPRRWSDSRRDWGTGLSPPAWRRGWWRSSKNPP